VDDSCRLRKRSERRPEGPRADPVYEGIPAPKPRRLDQEQVRLLRGAIRDLHQRAEITAIATVGADPDATFRHRKQALQLLPGTVRNGISHIRRWTEAKNAGRGLAEHKRAQKGHGSYALITKTE